MTQAATTTCNTPVNTTNPVTATTTSSLMTNVNGNGHEHDHVSDNKELIKRVIETPGCFMHTVKGTVPHLTPDTMRLQGFGGVHVSIEQLLQDHQPGGFDKWHFTLSKFLNLQDMILLCDLRDPSRYFKVPINSDRHVAIKTHKGVRRLTLEEYLKVVRTYQPDIVAAMADQISDTDVSTVGPGQGSSDAEGETQVSPSSGPGLKRVRKSIDRSLKWLDQILLDRQGMDALAADRTADEAKRRKMQMAATGQSHDSMNGVETLAQESHKPDLVTGKTSKAMTQIPWSGVSVFAHVLGSHVEQERIRSAQETARREAVDGFIVDANPLHGSSKETIFNLLKASLDHLPTEKPRMVYGLQAPEDVLKSIALGADLFDTSYPFHLTEDGKASLYSFGSNNNSINSIRQNNNDTPSEEVTTTRWINLWDDEHADKFIPILEGCGCYACQGGRHTRAYINHLLKAHEMLATVLLMSHNMYQYSKFFTNIRQSIQDGTFEQYSDSFIQQFGSEPERTGEIHAAQAIVEAALSKRNRLDGSNSNSNSDSSCRSNRNGDSSSDSEGEQGAMSKEEKAETRRKLKEQERFERKEKNRMEGLRRKKEKQQQLVADERVAEKTREP